MVKRDALYLPSMLLHQHSDINTELKNLTKRSHPPNYVETAYCMYLINSPEMVRVQIHLRPNKKSLTVLSVSVYLNGYMCGTS